MKISIKREQSSKSSIIVKLLPLNFTTMMKQYIKPQIKVIELKTRSSMLAGSPNPPEWAGEGSRKYEWEE